MSPIGLMRDLEMVQNSKSQCFVYSTMNWGQCERVLSSVGVSYPAYTPDLTSKHCSYDTFMLFKTYLVFVLKTLL